MYQQLHVLDTEMLSVGSLYVTNMADLFKISLQYKVHRRHVQLLWISNRLH